MEAPLNRNSQSSSRAEELILQKAAGSDNNELAGLAYSLLDLTSLSGDESEDALNDLLVLANPDNAPHVAAICVYPQFISYLARYRPDGVLLATVAGDFPGGEQNIEDKLEEVESLGEDVDEIDYVADRRFIDDKEKYRFELERVVELAGERPVKLIMETGSLSDDQINFASAAAVELGVKGLKTSTGKIGPGADLGALAIMMEAAAPSTLIKASGGVRDFDDAVSIMHLSAAIRGKGSLNPDNLRIGASSLAGDLLSYRD